MVSTSHGAYREATKPPSGELIHRFDVNLGQPWWKFAVQQPKFGSSPYRFDSGPFVVQGFELSPTRIWFDCWSYWCDHISSSKVPGRALKAIFSIRSPMEAS